MTEPVVVLTCGAARVEVDLAAGARATVWRVGDLDLLGAHDETPTGHGAFVMAPWPGRVRGNVVRHDGVAYPLSPNFGEWAIHGTVLDRRAEIVQKSANSVETLTTFGPGWPWSGAVRHTWQLTKSALTARLAVESDGDTFPAEVGWHPWFRRRLARGGPVRVDLPAAWMLERGADHLPTGKRVAADRPGPFDDAFFVPGGRATLEWPAALRLDVDTDCSWVVVFDELADWVCVEPQTAAPDGLSGGLLVGPGRPRTAWTTWRWTTP